MVAKQMTLECELAPLPLPTTIEKHLTVHSALLRDPFKNFPPLFKTKLPFK
jgi:hypothetical protein